MSSNDNRLLPLFTFLIGATIGAAVALAFAPESGEELRAQIKESAQAELVKLQEQRDRALEQLQQTLDQTRNELKNYAQQIQVGKKDA